MASKVKFVRLSDRLSRGCLVDVKKSGWSIAGYDVKEYPDDDWPTAQRFVDKSLREGKLEEASQAEWDEVHPDGEDHDLLADTGVEVKHTEVEAFPVQEGAIQAAARAHRAGIVRSGANPRASYDADQARRERLAAASDRLTGDDPDDYDEVDEEELDGDENINPAARSEMAGGSAAKSGARAEEVEEFEDEEAEAEAAGASPRRSSGSTGGKKVKKTTAKKQQPKKT